MHYIGCIVTSPNDAHSPVGPARRQGGRSPGRPRPGLFCESIWRAPHIDKSPAAVEYRFTATLWVVAEAATFGFDRKRLAVGARAGGNPTAVVSLLARDRCSDCTERSEASMRALVTGSSGHLGEALVRTLSQDGHEVVGLDIRESPFTTCAVTRRRFSSGCKAHPAIRSSRKQPGQAWR